MECNTPRWKKTEFWLTLVTVISGSTFLLGVFGEDTRDSTTETGHHAVESTSMIITLISGFAAKYFRDKRKKTERKLPVRRRKPKPNVADEPKPKRKTRPVLNKAGRELPGSKKRS